MKIKDIPLENQPRQRFLKFGASALSDAELLAIILQKGSKKENVIDLSNKLIKKYGINKLSELSVKELQEFDGIGQAKALQIKAVFEFTRRTKQTNKIYINSAKDVFKIYHQKLINEKQEKFYILMLDTKNKIIADEMISIGILDGAMVHPREIFRPAIKNSASKIIIVHNHPSGDSSPSQEDLIITEKIIESGNILGISVLDHVIIGEDYWSWRESR